MSLRYKGKVDVVVPVEIDALNFPDANRKAIALVQKLLDPLADDYAFTVVGLRDPEPVVETGLGTPATPEEMGKALDDVILAWKNAAAGAGRDVLDALGKVRDMLLEPHLICPIGFDPATSIAVETEPAEPEQVVCQNANAEKCGVCIHQDPHTRHQTCSQTITDCYHHSGLDCQPVIADPQFPADVVCNQEDCTEACDHREAHIPTERCMQDLEGCLLIKNRRCKPVRHENTNDALPYITGVPVAPIETELAEPVGRMMQCPNADDCLTETCPHRCPHLEVYSCGETKAPCSYGALQCEPVAGEAPKQVICPNAGDCDSKSCLHKTEHPDEPGCASGNPCHLGTYKCVPVPTIKEAALAEAMDPIPGMEERDARIDAMGTPEPEMWVCLGNQGKNAERCEGCNHGKPHERNDRCVKDAGDGENCTCAPVVRNIIPEPHQCNLVQSAGVRWKVWTMDMGGGTLLSMPRVLQQIFVCECGRNEWLDVPEFDADNEEGS